MCYCPRSGFEKPAPDSYWSRKARQSPVPSEVGTSIRASPSSPQARARKSWIHLMFLALQSRSQVSLGSTSCSSPFSPGPRSVWDPPHVPRPSVQVPGQSWIHLMFIALQSSSQVSLESIFISSLVVDRDPPQLPSAKIAKIL